MRQHLCQAQAAAFEHLQRPVPKLGGRKRSLTDGLPGNPILLERRRLMLRRSHRLLRHVRHDAALLRSSAAELRRREDQHAGVSDGDRHHRATHRPAQLLCIRGRPGANLSKPGGALPQPLRQQPMLTSPGCRTRPSRSGATALGRQPTPAASPRQLAKAHCCRTRCLAGWPRRSTSQ